MKQFFNRTLALLLAVVLCFSMVPMAAFVTELDNGVSSDIGENPIESVPQDVPNEIDSEMQDVDVLVLYARDPISKVQSDLGGGTNYLTSYVVTRKAIVDELSAHEHDSHYLGTPYAGEAVQSTWTTARGQIRTIVYNGEPWMVGKDIAVALGYSNTKDALAKHVDQEDKGGRNLLPPLHDP